MKTFKLLTGIAALTMGFAAYPLLAASEENFASPDEAVTALQNAASARDKAALEKIFGPGVKMLRTGDEVEDAKHRDEFAQALADHCRQVTEGDNRIVLEIGTTNYPFPIPLVKSGSQWHFDTEAGQEEIINRHVGSDELHAVGICTAYVEAQRKYAAINGGSEYATKFKSSPGKKDGLFWRAENGESPSPFSEVVAEAHAEGYHHNAQGTESKPYEGYFFRVLTRQGHAAPGGKMSYVHHGKMTKGFALIAYPAKWDQSGIMTFIVNQDGKVYQKNLGPNTVSLACSIKEYNPDNGWAVVDDQGIYEKP